MSQTVATTLKIIGIIIAILVLYFIRDVVGYLLLAFVFASALKPGVDFLEKKKVPRALSAVLISFLFLMFWGTLVYIVFPPLISEIQNFISNLPQYWENFLEWIPRAQDWLETIPFGQNIENTINQSLQGLSKAVGSVVGAVYGFFGQLFDFLFILIVAFYLLIEKNVGDRFSQIFFAKEDQIKRKISKYWNLAEKIAGVGAGLYFPWNYCRHIGLYWSFNLGNKICFNFSSFSRGFRNYSFLDQCLLV